jgi:hypothetical protein
MKGIQLESHKVCVEFDEREDMTLSVSRADKDGNVISSMPLNVKQAEDVAYAILRLIYIIKNNAKLPDIKPEA